MTGNFQFSIADKCSTYHFDIHEVRTLLQTTFANVQYMYCLEYLKISWQLSILFGKWIIWNDKKQKTIFKKVHGFVYKLNIQIIHKPSSVKTLNMKSSKFKLMSVYIVAPRTERAPPSEGVLARSPSIFTSIFTCGLAKRQRKIHSNYLLNSQLETFLLIPLWFYS